MIETNSLCWHAEHAVEAEAVAPMRLPRSILLVRLRRAPERPRFGCEFPMIDLGDGWSVKWNGPDIFTLVRGDHEYSFDAPMTGRRLWKTVHTVRLYEMSDRWDRPFEDERLTLADKVLLASKARQVTGGWFRELVFVGEGT